MIVNKQPKFMWLEMSSFKDMKDYENELKALGWCVECQGYGQDHQDGSDCQECKGTGKLLI